MFTTIRAGIVFALAFFLAACSASPTANVAGSSVPGVPLAAPGPLGGHHVKPHDVIGGGGGRFQVSLGDAGLPNGSGIKAIDVGIDRVLVTDAAGNVSTVAQYDSPRIVNVMQYQGGSTTPIGQANVDQTTYASLTIVVDTASSNVVGYSGSVRPLFFSDQSSRSTSNFGTTTTTTAYSSGTVAITFNKAFQVSGSMVDLDVDFNALESILPQSRYVDARASLSVAQRGFEGSIAGSVTNAWGNAVTNAVVVATAADGTAAATGFTDQYGNFLLHTLVAGSYQLTVYNQYLTASGWEVDALNNTSINASVGGPSAGVLPGQTASVGTIRD
jgi:hypothetical protein